LAPFSELYNLLNGGLCPPKWTGKAPKRRLPFFLHFFHTLEIIPLSDCPVHSAEDYIAPTQSCFGIECPALSVIGSHGRRNGSNLREYPLGGIVTLPAL